ncbi:MAG: hypothetical protein IPP60_10835 [Sphingobacteriales bacterium]|nr:hypothetical protein [Sphingobacteriales bacterium]
MMVLLGQLHANFEGAIYDPTLSFNDTILVAKGTYQPSKTAFHFDKQTFSDYSWWFPSGGGTLADRNWQNDSTILLGRMNSVIFLVLHSIILLLMVSILLVEMLKLVAE